MRNTKVIDIIEELKDYGAKVDVYDPWVDHKAEKAWYSHGIIDDPLSSDKRYDAIVVAVAQMQFKDYSDQDYEKLSMGESVIFDVKNIVHNTTWKL